MSDLIRLMPPELAKVVNAKPTLEKAANITSVPWQMLAAVWYRESFSVEPPVTPGGPFQFDPEPTKNVGEALLKDFTKLDASEIDFYLKKGVNVFPIAAVFCGCWLRHQCKYDLVAELKEPDPGKSIAIMDAFYGYNGRAWGQHPQSSPYVYNEFDEMHHGMIMRGSIPDRYAANGRQWITIIDRRPGAFTVYTQLLKENV
jgi:hypothetical protein